MDIREIRYIIEIANTRNMTKAAANLFITQPALSKMLKKVELELGMPLFYREGNVMSPTEAGTLLVEHGTGISQIDIRRDGQSTARPKVHETRQSHTWRPPCYSCL